MSPPASDSVAGLRAAGLGGVAIKPTEHDIDRVGTLPEDTTLVVDYEGASHLPEAAMLADLADDRPVRVTTPVRADGFDPLGDDSRVEWLPDGVGRVLVAGHRAYLDKRERRRAVAPRFRAAAADCTAPWVGTEGVERVALATGQPQFELFSPSTARDLRALRAAGFDGELVVYAPVVLSTDENAVLDALGAYAARREPVAADLPATAPTNSRAGGPARERLLDGCEEYALCGEPAAVGNQVESLHEAGADEVVGYPARGIDELL